MSQDDLIAAWGDDLEYKRLGLEVFRVVNKEDEDGAQLNCMDTPKKTLPNFTATGGMQNWIFETSSKRWAWIIFAARRRPWFAGSSG